MTELVGNSVLPHNRQLELDVLVETFSGPEWRRADIISKMRPEFFYHGRLRKLWLMSIEDGTEAHIAYDKLWEKDHALKAFLDRDKFVEAVRDRQRYYDACAMEPDLIDPEAANGSDDTIERLWKLWQRREAISYVKHQMLPGLERGELPLMEAANTFTRLAVQDGIKEDTGVSSVADEIMSEFNGGAAESVLNAFGMPKVDEMMRGLRRDDFIVIAAPPNTGKTVLALDLQLRRAVAGYGKQAIFSFEMLRKSVAQALVSKYTKIPADFLAFGYPNTPGKDDAMRAVTDALSFVQQNFIIYDPDVKRSKPFTPARLRAMVLNLQAQCSGSGSVLDTVTIDYLQLLGSDNKELTEWTRAIKDLALEVKVPIICVSSFNREYPKNVRYAISRGKAPPQPIMADLRDCGNLEFDASKILFLLKRYDQNGNPFECVRDLRQAKNKFGPADVEVALQYHAKTLRFEEAE